MSLSKPLRQHIPAHYEARRRAAHRRSLIKLPKKLMSSEWRELLFQVANTSLFFHSGMKTLSGLCLSARFALHVTPRIF